MKDHSPVIVYQQQIEKHSADLKRLLQKRNLLGWLRLVVFVLTIIVSYKVFVVAGLVGLAPAIIGIGLFVFLVFIDSDTNEKIINTKTLIHINEEELKILHHN